MSGLDEDTVRKWVWIYCAAIQALKRYKVRICFNNPESLTLFETNHLRRLFGLKILLRKT